MKHKPVKIMTLKEVVVEEHSQELVNGVYSALNITEEELSNLSNGSIVFTREYAIHFQKCLGGSVDYWHSVAKLGKVR